MHTPTWRSLLEGMAWPAVFDGAGNANLALLFQLEQTQWWPTHRLQKMQFNQAHLLLGHALRHVPYYQQTFDGIDLDFGKPPDAESWRHIPILRRTDIQQNFEQLRSRYVPAAHGRGHTVETSGSTGRPIKTRGTGLVRVFAEVMTLRDHLWHRRDFSGKLLAVRFSVPPTGDIEHLDSWGSATDKVIQTGPCVRLEPRLGAARHAQCVAEENPHYLIGYPSNLMAIAREFRDQGYAAPNLGEVRPFGEVLPHGFIETCRRVWDARVVDNYSSLELNNIALQCPEHPHYHVQSETILIEVLNDAGEPCGPGEVGRVVATQLHNFEMPLIRYEIGDYAEVGGPCLCGRGLPVLKRILGRTRNMFTLPNGDQVWPTFMDDGTGLRELIRCDPPIEQYQIVQRAHDEIEVRLVMPRELSDQERSDADRYIREQMGFAFRIRYTAVDEIPRASSGKFEEFRSEVTPQPTE